MPFERYRLGTREQCISSFEKICKHEPQLVQFLPGQLRAGNLRHISVAKLNHDVVISEDRIILYRALCEYSELSIQRVTVVFKRAFCAHVLLSTCHFHNGCEK